MSRPYAGEDDLRRMLDFLSSSASAGPPGAYWHPGDAVWGMYQNTVFDPVREVRLWEGSLLGFAWLEEPDVGSYCLCWFDPAGRTGLFEPVGTRPAHRKKGLGRAVMLEGLRRLHHLGAQHAAVTALHHNRPAAELYESLGFRTAYTERLYGEKVRA